MKNVLPYKTIPEHLFNKPIADDTISSELNNMSKKLTVFSEQAFLKILRDVVKQKYNEVK